MLASCPTHGYYRGSSCPKCGQTGKFLMSDRELDNLGRILAGLLRHFPDKLDLKVDGRGWIDLKELLQALHISRSGFQWLREEHLIALVETDPKGRYQIDGGMIRATYGHTIDVNLDDLPTAEVDVLYYPVTEEELEFVLENGLHPVDRKKVHLSGSIEKALEAGRVRTEKPVILKIDVKKAKEDGIEIYKAGNDVYVADSIDKKYLSKLDDSEKDNQ
ncbi:MAG TPA: RNA 2'-phosphotransferase [Thermoplasmatales archaeon]|nr:RNA 2'-phosphotransferase [Thermoplasmatales archaeon]